MAIADTHVATAIIRHDIADNPHACSVETVAVACTGKSRSESHGLCYQACRCLIAVCPYVSTHSDMCRPGMNSCTCIFWAF